MNNLFVNCNHCGEQLQIEDEIMFTTCRSCQSSLEIVRTFNSVYTKVVEKQPLKTNAEIVMQSMELSKDDIYNQIELLDKEWEKRLPIFMVNGKLPNSYGFEVILYPPALFFLYEGVMERVFLLILIALIVIIPLTISLVMKSTPNRKAYRKAKSNYEQKRANLLNQLNQ